VFRVKGFVVARIDAERGGGVGAAVARFSIATWVWGLELGVWGLGLGVESTRQHPKPKTLHWNRPPVEREYLVGNIEVELKCARRCKLAWAHS
jgi:hypothetical protein